MDKKQEIPQEKISEEDAELLVKHYGNPPEESTVSRIMEDACKRRSRLVEENSDGEKGPSKSKRR